VCVGADGGAGVAGGRGAGVAPNCGLPLPSSPTGRHHIGRHHIGRHHIGRHHIRTAAFFAHVSTPPFRQIERCDFTCDPAFVKLAKRSRAFRFFAASARKRLSRQHHFCQRCFSLSGCISLLLQRAIPNLGGSRRSLRNLSFVPLKWGSDAVISGRHVVSPLADHQEFRCCNVWSTSDLSCGHLSRNRVNGAPAFGAPTASRLKSLAEKNLNKAT
jgi:hypothetical protein